MNQRVVWRWEYQNDTGPRDDGFVEWYDLYAGDRIVGRISSKEDAEAICAAMNAERDTKEKHHAFSSDRSS